MKNGIGLLPVNSILAVTGLPAKQSSSGDSGGAPDPGWPREKYSNGTRLVSYRPQVNDWKNFQELTWRMGQGRR